MNEPLPWQIREHMTLLFFSGKSLADVEWPEQWTHDPLRRIWERERGGEMTLCLSDMTIAALPARQEEGV